MAWPIPPQLSFPTGHGRSSRVGVSLQLLDGQRLHGEIDAGLDPGESSPLSLWWNDQPVAFAHTAIRRLGLREPLLLLPQPAHAPALPLLQVQVEFVDGLSLHGETLGYVNRKHSGVYLYLRREDGHCEAVWLPRLALKSVHLQRPPAASEPRSGLARPVATTLDGLAALLEQTHTLPVITMAEALFEIGEIDAVTLHSLQQASGAQLRAFIDSRQGDSRGSPWMLEHARARTVRTPEVDADAFEIDPTVLERLPWSAAARLETVPLGLLDGRLMVASPTPLNHELEAQLGVLANGPVSLVWSSKAQVDRRLMRAPPPRPAAAPGEAPRPAAAGDGTGDRPELQSLLASAQSEIRVQGAVVHSYAVDEHSSIVQLVKRIILDAHAQKASDVHIETNPDEGQSRVRLRKDGELEDYLLLPPDLRAALVSRIKVMSKLDISERRRPQDGKINFADFSTTRLELRVAILPTHDGLEDVVLRLLASSRPIPLAQLGFSPRDEALVKKLASRPYGLVLACGPTGSGKTTTLHSLLAEINTDSRKIWTAEDPIEITQPGLRQLQVNPKIGLSFASAMRAFLRADPDVIMIGEVRDEETARISIEASLTGHLVLSTLHTNNAAESVVRLLDLGMDPMNFGDSLVGIVAQRLVRALCPACKQAEALSPAQFEALAIDCVAGTAVPLEAGRERLLLAGGWASPHEARRWKPVGCAHCSGKGYKGRMGVYEVLQNTPELKQRIQSRASSNLVFEQAIADGMHSLKQDALEKICAGNIDLKQAAGVYS
jgi:type II secretory ATPase GspE/PulE/Tfp pilus assembly ATPase PilB-like protein